jgi:excisionase family DNA binding protein
MAQTSEVRLMTLAEVAERVGLDSSRLRVLIGQGRLPATKYGKTWLVRESDVKAFEKQPRLPGRPAMKKATKK